MVGLSSKHRTVPPATRIGAFISPSRNSQIFCAEEDVRLSNDATQTLMLEYIVGDVGIGKVIGYRDELPIRGIILLPDKGYLFHSGSKVRAGKNQMRLNYLSGDKQ